MADDIASQPSRTKWIAFLLLILAVASTRAFPASDASAHGPRIVLIIRHAEKPDDKSDPDLSPRGFERAGALAKAIPDHFPRPDYLFATKRSKGSNRPVETITPLSKALQEPIETTFADDDFAQLAHEVLTHPKFDGKTVLIAWHHQKIPDLAKALGVQNAPDKWNPDVFDRVWQITYENSVPVWKDLPEAALPGDSQK
jgi:broad specificity phosphatase PhoE